MRIALLLSLINFFIANFAFAQEPPDSTLQEVVVQAYNAQRPLAESAATVAVIDQATFSAFHNTSLVPSINTVAGVRMEERSPGSYRFAIRGSSIRSPFGIRNVKMYLNGLPFTDAGGNTYLNLIDPALIDRVEVIKGPGGSLYGAGTGGVVLLNMQPVKNTFIQYASQLGSYETQRNALGGGLHRENFSGQINFIRQRSDGYREQSASQRDAVNANFVFNLQKAGTLSADILFTDLFYETPGGLTLDQYNVDPSQARPAAGPNGGAVSQKASVSNKTLYSGLTHDISWNNKVQTITSIYGAKTSFENPSIREYEIRDESNTGVRSVTTYSSDIGTSKLVLTPGLELQYMSSPIEKFQNLSGTKGIQTANDNLSVMTSAVFAQGELTSEDWIFSAGLSLNTHRISYRNESTNERFTRKFDPVISPRLAILRKINDVSVFASFTRGFSPPTIADVYPSGGEFSKDVEAEYGNNFELGMKGNLLSDKLYYEISAYDFRLRNTIVRRVSDANVESFVNAGKTVQRGVEATVAWDIIKNENAFLSLLKVNSTYAYQHYRFDDYTKVDVDLSGNKLTGVAPTTFYGAMTIEMRRRLSVSVSVNYVDHIPLNDENTAFAKSYDLVAARINYSIPINNYRFVLYIGADNLLDEKYSLGNDINALGGRFYNAAAPANYFGGIKVNVNFK